MLRDVLDRVQGKPPAARLPKECLDFLHAHEIPADIIADLEASSYSDWINIGPVTVLPMPELVEQNTGSISLCIDNGFLTLAGGANGDPVAVDRRNRRMVFISHDILWDENYKDFSECIHATPFLYEEFWERAVSDEDFPCDYWEAIERWK